MTETNEKFEIFGCYAQSELWASLNWVGKPELGPWLTESGEDIIDLVEQGRCEEIGFATWFAPGPSSRDTKRPRADFLWAGGLAYKIVSAQFAETLIMLGVSGLEVQPADLRTRKGEAIKGYVQLFEDLTGESEVTTPFWQNQTRATSLLVTKRIVDGLRDAGVTRFKVEKHPVEA